jgi:hypothetical protein
MGIFTGIGAITPDATRYKKHIRSLETKRANQMIYNVSAQQEFRQQEDPREQAQLNQSMWGRGLGKSTIADQDKSRLDMIQRQRNEKLSQAMDYAQEYKRMIKRKHRWQKVSQYYEAIDGILGVAAGAGGSSSGGFSMDGGDSGGGGGFGGGGMGGDFGSYNTG